MITYGIIGYGFVGKAMHQFECEQNKVMIYDVNPELCYPTNVTMEQINAVCDLIFVCVPTPMNSDGSCYTNIVENVVSKLNKDKVIIKSTVPVGTSKRLECSFSPEFLTEKNYLNDIKNCNNWIFGIKENNKYNLQFFICELIFNAYESSQIFYNRITYLTTDEAEMIKYFRNAFLATKVSFCNEISEFCKLKNINYENVRIYGANDERITLHHTKVPGHDGMTGFGGTCLPKDCNSLYHQMRNAGMESYVIKNIILRNDNVDRVDADWKNDVGRTVVN